MSSAERSSRTAPRVGGSSSSARQALSAYRDIAVIGKGSFGRILKVQRQNDGAYFARKELDYSIMSERDKAQILSEIRILSLLNHVNIVQYVERIHDERAGILHIIMEFCEGGDLGSLIKRNRREKTTIPEEVVWAKLAQMVSALDACHNGMPVNPNTGTGITPSILHRDLKPENVFLDSEHNVKLGDFGLSKQLEASTALASTYVGTPYYMSPELATGASYDAKSDVWALGCITYELCALRPPFDATSQAELTAKIKLGHVPSLPRGYSRQLDDLVRQMLNLDPRKRPNTKKLLQDHKVRNELRSFELRDLHQIILEKEQTKSRQLFEWEENLKELERGLREREARLNVKEAEMEAWAQSEVDRRVQAYIQQASALSSYAGEGTAGSGSSHRPLYEAPVRSTPARPVRPSIGARRVSNMSDVSMEGASRRSISFTKLGASTARRASTSLTTAKERTSKEDDEWYDTNAAESSSSGGENDRGEENNRGSRSAPAVPTTASLRASRLSSSARRSTHAASSRPPSSASSSTRQATASAPPQAEAEQPAPTATSSAAPLSSSFSSSPSRRRLPDRPLTTRKSTGNIGRQAGIASSVTATTSTARLRNETAPSLGNAGVVTTHMTPRRLAPAPPVPSSIPGSVARLLERERAAAGVAANTSVATVGSDVSMRDATFGTALGGDKENKEEGATGSLLAALQRQRRKSIVERARRLTIDQQNVLQQQDQDDQRCEYGDEGDRALGKKGSQAPAQALKPASWDDESLAQPTRTSLHAADEAANASALYDLSHESELPSPFLKKKASNLESKLPAARATRVKVPASSTTGSTAASSKASRPSFGQQVTARAAAQRVAAAQTAGQTVSARPSLSADREGGVSGGRRPSASGIVRSAPVSAATSTSSTGSSAARRQRPSAVASATGGSMPASTAVLQRKQSFVAAGRS